MKNLKPSFLKTEKLWLVAAVFCFAAALLSLCLGDTAFSPLDLLRLVSGGEIEHETILRFSRLPRTLACLMAGAALASAGVVLQTVLMNKLASPSIIGVNAGAGLGVTICCALGLLSGWAVSAAAFLGSLAAVCLIALLARATGASRTTVILSGVAMNSVLTALSESITVLDPDVAIMNLEFRVGGFSSVSFSRLVPAMVIIAVALIVLFTVLNELDLVALGDETARGLGLKAGAWRFLFLVLAALLAGAAVSFAGLLGFVGLIVPHFVRLFTGSGAGKLLPVSALMGAGFVCLCDLAARTLFYPYELPVGIIMSLIGAPAFVLLLVRYRGGRHA